MKYELSADPGRLEIIKLYPHLPVALWAYQGINLVDLSDQHGLIASQTSLPLQISAHAPKPEIMPMTHSVESIKSTRRLAVSDRSSACLI